MKKLVQRIKQFRLIGYVVIGISLWELERDYNSLILKMFLLILFTELSSRGTSKTKIESLKTELGIDDSNSVKYEDRKELRIKSLNKKEQEDRQRVGKEIKEHYTDKL